MANEDRRSAAQRNREAMPAAAELVDWIKTSFPGAVVVAVRDETTRVQVGAFPEESEGER